MKYLEVATLRENLLEMVRAGEAMADIENALKEYSDAVFHNGFAHHINEGSGKYSDGIVLHKPEPEYHRAELIQLTAAALTGAIASDQVEGPSEKIAAFAVQCATDALDFINKK